MGRAILQCVWGSGGDKGRVQIPQRLRAKLKILSFIPEAVESHGGIFSGSAIWKSLAEQEDRLQGMWTASRELLCLCIIQVRNE